MSNRNRTERTRRLVHLAFGSCALLVGFLGRWGSAGVAAAAVLYNGLVAPRLRLDAGYRREGEGRASGLLTYPLAVLLLLLLTPAKVAAGAWAVLAAADPVAATVGERFKWPRSWRKSLLGTAAGFLAGSAACYGVLAFLDVRDALAPACCAGAAGALAELCPVPFDDNLPIAAAAAIALLFWGL